MRYFLLAAGTAETIPKTEHLYLVLLHHCHFINIKPEVPGLISPRNKALQLVLSRNHKQRVRKEQEEGATENTEKLSAYFQRDS